MFIIGDKLLQVTHSGISRLTWEPVGRILINTTQIRTITIPDDYTGEATQKSFVCAEKPVLEITLVSGDLVWITSKYVIVPDFNLGEAIAKLRESSDQNSVKESGK